MKGSIFVVFIVALVFGSVYVWGKYGAGGGPEAQQVKLYYYDLANDQNATNDTQCSQTGLIGVSRPIERTSTHLEETIRLLLAGQVTDTERANGVTTEFPLEGFELIVTTLEQGTLTLMFEDPFNKTSGGSCRVSILRAQIEQTAKQFPGVQRVIIMPPDILQP